MGNNGGERKIVFLYYDSNVKGFRVCREEAMPPQNSHRGDLIKAEDKPVKGKWHIVLFGSRHYNQEGKRRFRVLDFVDDEKDIPGAEYQNALAYAEDWARQSNSRMSDITGAF